MKGNFVYCFYDIDNCLLYIGKSTVLRSRLVCHFSKESLEQDTWKKEINRDNIIIHECNNPTDLELYETFFINKYTPKYNKDKVYNYLPTIELPYLTPITYSFEMGKDKLTFKDCCIKYIQDENTREEIEKIFPIIKEAFYQLGKEKLKALNYRQNLIKNELDILTELEESDEIHKFLNFNVGDIISKKTAKQAIQSFYDYLGINRTAKATDLSNWYSVVDYNKRVDGQVVTFIKIVTCNIKCR